MENLTIDQKIQRLLDLGSSLFIEHYSHTSCDMYKYLNPFTEWSEEKVVLHPVTEGIEKSLDAAIADIQKRRKIFFTKTTHQ